MLQDSLCKSCGKHKGKNCSSYTKDHDKEVKAHQTRSHPSHHTKREQDKQQGVMNPQNCQRTINKMATVSLTY